MITSRLDTDFYKFRMSLFAYHFYRHVDVKMELSCRDNAYYITEAQAKSILSQCPRLNRLHTNCEGSAYHLTTKEAQFIRKTIASNLTDDLVDEWLDELIYTELPLPEYNNGKITVSGPWWLTMFWETYIMSMHSELVSNISSWGNLGQKTIEDILHEKLSVKQNILSAIGNLHIVDFGTRRRFSADWQRRVLKSLWGERLIEGTSNTLMAMEMDMPVVGTVAHEVFMVPMALHSENLITRRAMPMIVMQQWESLFGSMGTCGLTDTYTTTRFLREATESQMRRWGSFRHDSGDALLWYQWIEGAIKGKQPFKPKLIFSDALKIEDIIRINHFVDHDRFDAVFGWGTNLTNDWGQKPPSTIMKVVSANGLPTCKLSDDYGKAFGPSKEIEAQRSV